MTPEAVSARPVAPALLDRAERHFARLRKAYLTLLIARCEVEQRMLDLAADFRGLRKLRDAVGRRFYAGVVLYDGEVQAGFGQRLFAVPIRALWETV